MAEPAGGREIMPGLYCVRDVPQLSGKLGKIDGSNSERSGNELNSGRKLKRSNTLGSLFLDVFINRRD